MREKIKENLSSSEKNKIYLDYAATSPMDKRVINAMKPYLSDKFGNAGSIHSFGQEAISAVDKARENIASFFETDFRNVVFTGSATEANNLVLRGAVKYFYRFVQSDEMLPLRIVTSAIEHDSIYSTLRDLEEEGIEVIHVSVDKKGLVKVSDVINAINEQTVLVSIMSVNNEVGSIQPIGKIADEVKSVRKKRIEENKKKGIRNQNYPIMHTDAAQALAFSNDEYKSADLITISAHKINGPKGVGALITSRDFDLKRAVYPIITGGEQEYGFRSGTENVAGIVGLGEAIKVLSKEKEEDKKRVKELREMLINEITKVFPKAQINGGNGGILHILNMQLQGVDADDLAIALDMAGIAISRGSACGARVHKESRVLRAMGVSENSRSESARISIGKFTTREEIEEFGKVLKNGH